MPVYIGGAELNVATALGKWNLPAKYGTALPKNYFSKEITDELELKKIVIAFQIYYAIGFLGAGGLIDKLGTKIGYALATALWSVAAVGHAAALSTMGFFIARGALGFTEAGNFPAAIKAVAEWFPKKEKALAMGFCCRKVFNGPCLVVLPFLAARFLRKAVWVIQNRNCFAAGHGGTCGMECQYLYHCKRYVSQKRYSICNRYWQYVRGGRRYFYSKNCW